MSHLDVKGLEDMGREGLKPVGIRFDTLTECEVARALRCSTAALRKMRRERRGPRWTRVGRLIRYPVEWLSEYLQQNACQQNSEARRLPTGDVPPTPGKATPANSPSSQRPGDVAKISIETADVRHQTRRLPMGREGQ